MGYRKPGRPHRMLLLPVLGALAMAACSGNLFGTYDGPAPQTADLVDEAAVVRSVVRDPAGERQGQVSLVHLDRLVYQQPGRSGDVNRVVALLHANEGPSLDSLGLEVGDTVRVSTRYVGITLSAPAPGLVPGWAGYEYLEYPIAGHRLRAISR